MKGLRIDRSTPSLICIQVPLAERRSFADELSTLATHGGPVVFTGTGGNLRVELTDSEFSVDATQHDKVILKVRAEDCAEIVEAIQEHLENNIELPLDHSLEAFGAKIYPETIDDVVVETI